MLGADVEARSYKSKDHVHKSSGKPKIKFNLSPIVTFQSLPQNRNKEILIGEQDFAPFRRSMYMPLFLSLGVSLPLLKPFLSISTGTRQTVG